MFPEDLLNDSVNLRDRAVEVVRPPNGVLGSHPPEPISCSANAPMATSRVLADNLRRRRPCVSYMLEEPSGRETQPSWLTHVGTPRHDPTGRTPTH